MGFDDAFDDLILNQPTYNITVVPEPTGMVLMSSVLVGTILFRRRTVHR
jgi:hypothetical protein